MNFAAAYLLPGLALAAIPVILHLLNRRQLDIVDWAAVRFLVDDSTSRRRNVQLEDWLLMLLRVLMVSVLVLALAQPMWPSAEPIAGGPSHVLFVVDGSAAMFADDEGATPFARATAAIDAWLANADSASSVSVLLASETPVWLTARPLLVSASSRADLARQLAQLTPVRGDADLPRAIDAAASRLAEFNQSAGRIIVLTDQRQSAFRPRDRERWAYAANVLGRSNARVDVIPVAEPITSASNLVVQAIDLPTRVLTADRPARVRVRLLNAGAAPSPAGELVVLLNGEPAGQTAVPSLAPNGTTVIEEAVRITSGSAALISAELDVADANRVDNRLDVVAPIGSGLNVVICDGDPRGTPEDSESFFVRAAIDPGGLMGVLDGAGAGRGLFATRVITVPELRNENLSDTAVVILLNPPSLAEDAARNLRAFVDAGGGLIVAVGELTTANGFNSALVATGLSPVALHSMTNVEDPAGLALSSTAPTHPAVALFADAARSDASACRVYRYWHTTRPGSTGTPGQAILHAANDAPLAFAAQRGKGKIVLFAVPLDADWTNWPARQAFPILLQDTLSYVVETRVPRLNVTPGDAVNLALAQYADDSLMVLDPLGRESRWTVGTPLIGQVPGVYRVRDRAQTLARFSVQPTASESDTGMLTDSDRQTLEQHGVHFGRHSVASLGVRGTGAVPISTWLLLAFVTFLVVELVITRRSIAGGG